MLASACTLIEHIVCVTMLSTISNGYKGVSFVGRGGINHKTNLAMSLTVRYTQQQIDSILIYIHKIPHSLEALCFHTPDLGEA